MQDSNQIRRLVGVDLFAGAGGLGLGFEQAGFDIVAAVELDPVHCATHRFNFPDTEVIPRSVERLTGDQIRKIGNIGTQVVACVFGGPPCQGFSLIGQRALDDPRNRYVLDFVRIVGELDARTFVFENVKGLTVGKHRMILDEIIEAFDKIGYSVQMPWKVLNSGNYFVPQSRQRLILIGAKRGERIPSYPNSLSNISGHVQPIAGLPSGPTCLDALDDIPDADQFPALLQTDSVQASYLGKPSSYAAELRCATPAAWHFGYIREWDSNALTSSARTKHTKISRRRFAETECGTVSPISRFFKLPRDGVANTLRAGSDGARGGFTSPRPIHYKYNRCITVREMARLHGFPDWFRFNVTKWHGARQIGNAVPPPLGRVIATEVGKALNVHPTRPYGSIALGDPTLLSLTMSEAAKHFGVLPLSGRRDRKSTHGKRKQIDIEREFVRGNAIHT